MRRKERRPPETAGSIGDFLHLLAAGNIHIQQFFDELLFRRFWFEQINPKRFGQCFRRRTDLLQCSHLQGVSAWFEQLNHNFKLMVSADWSEKFR